MLTMYYRPYMAHCLSEYCPSHPHTLTPSHLQAMELKDPSLVETYTSYLERYDECKREGATPELMFPGDLPTLQVLVDFVVHLCCMPVRAGHMTWSHDWYGAACR